MVCIRPMVLQRAIRKAGLMIKIMYLQAENGRGLEGLKFQREQKFLEVNWRSKALPEFLANS